MKSLCPNPNCGSTLVFGHGMSERGWRFWQCWKCGQEFAEQVPVPTFQEFKALQGRVKPRKTGGEP